MGYNIGQQIGDRGGFGSVHICISETGEQYAIKLLENMDENAADRFAKEIRLIMRLSHPNIIKIIAYNCVSERKLYYATVCQQLKSGSSTVVLQS